jgi:hypothetical protein
MPSQVLISKPLFSLCVPDGLMSLMRDIGRGYLALCSYNCKEAISILSQLPSHHYNTGWVLGQIGRAHFELAEYMQVRESLLLLGSSFIHKTGIVGI